MEAAPVSAVFINHSSPRPLFNYVYKKPESNRLELCSYNTFGFAEQFLASKETGKILKEAAGTREKP